MPPSFRPKGARTRVEINREADARRGSARDRGYSSAWDQASKAHLAAHPICAYCLLDGVVTPATLVDHLYPHHRFEGVFWLVEWWVEACQPCHAGMKQSVEREGEAAIDALARRLGRPVRRPPAQTGSDKYITASGA